MLTVNSELAHRKGAMHKPNSVSLSLLCNFPLLCLPCLLYTEAFARACEPGGAVIIPAQRTVGLISNPLLAHLNFFWCRFTLPLIIICIVLHSWLNIRTEVSEKHDTMIFLVIINTLALPEAPVSNAVFMPYSSTAFLVRFHYWPYYSCVYICMYRCVPFKLCDKGCKMCWSTY